MKHFLILTLLAVSLGSTMTSCVGHHHRVDDRQDHRDDRQDGRQDHRDDRQDARQDRW